MWRRLPATLLNGHYDGACLINERAPCLLTQNAPRPLNRRYAKVVIKTCLPLAIALLSAGCATNLERAGHDSGAGSTFTGTLNLQYVGTWPLISPRAAYLTGSNLAEATQPMSVEGAIETARRSATTGVVSVEGPAPMAENLAHTASEAFGVASRWYPSEFTDQLDVSVTLIADGPARFSRAFFLEQSPWPMAFQARYDQVAEPAQTASLASTLTHEGYHLANSLSKTGEHLSSFRDRPVAGWVYEETAARLFGGCVLISLGQSVDLNRVPEVTIDQVNPENGARRQITAPLPAEFVSAVIGALSKPHDHDDYSGPLLYLGFYRTLFHHYAGGADVIEPGTEAAQRLLAACDRVGPDVTQVPVELLAIGGADAQTPS